MSVYVITLISSCSLSQRMVALTLQNYYAGIRRPGLKVTQSSRVCSAHFATGKTIPYVQSPSLVKEKPRQRRQLVKHPLPERSVASKHKKTPGQACCRIPSLVTLTQNYLQQQLSHNAHLATISGINDQLAAINLSQGDTITCLRYELDKAGAELIEVENDKATTIANHTKQTHNFLQTNKVLAFDINRLTQMLDKLSMEKIIAEIKASVYEKCKYRLCAEDFTDIDSDIQWPIS